MRICCFQFYAYGSVYVEIVTPLYPGLAKCTAVCLGVVNSMNFPVVVSRKSGPTILYIKRFGYRISSKRAVALWTAVPKKRLPEAGFAKYARN
jgi:hypothetical protein